MSDVPAESVIGAAHTDGPVLAVRDLRRRFGALCAVDGLSFEIARGETYGLLGPNGAGKTTAINMVAGLLRPDDGEIRLLGRSTRGDRHGSRVIGLVPQEIALYPDLSARENLRFFGRMQGLAGVELDRRVDKVLEIVGLADRARERVDTYSGGMQRRANIAVGLLHEPQLLILDEPTVGVDPQSRNAILESVANLGTAGLSVLYTTHYMEEAERLCARVGIIDHGRLIAEGTRSELVAALGGRQRVTLRVDGLPAARDAWEAWIAAIPGVDAVHRLETGEVEVTCRDAADLLARAFAASAGSGEPIRGRTPRAAAGAGGVRITGVDVAEGNLESVFLTLTGKALRDTP